ncbi:MAG TPA: hypothetical protein DDW76_37870, partial [Cyanobacteria bacterium UBA11369]|nr:hypothetical protein [Cyanobacteria bacterium UBA11369]
MANLLQGLIAPLTGELIQDLMVKTDKLDYAPGSTAIVTASGFEVGSTIEFGIADDPTDPGDDGDADVYAPFSVTDGGVG